MSEVSPSGKHHRDVSRIGRVDNLLISNRPARLNNGRYTGLCEGRNPIGERKERVGRRNFSEKGESGVKGFARRDL